MAKVITRRALKVNVSEIEVGNGFRYKGVLYQMVSIDMKSYTVNMATGQAEAVAWNVKVVPMDIVITALPLIRS